MQCFPQYWQEYWHSIGKEIEANIGVSKFFGRGTEQNTWGSNYPHKKTNSACLAYYFGKWSKAITNYLSERVHVSFDGEEPDKVVLHRSSFSDLHLTIRGEDLTQA